MRYYKIRLIRVKQKGEWLKHGGNIAVTEDVVHKFPAADDETARHEALVWAERTIKNDEASYFLDQTTFEQIEPEKVLRHIPIRLPVPA